jgi:Ras-related protein Rab-28
VYDITNSPSFKNLEDWYKIVNKYCAGRKPLFALVGNKSKSDFQLILNDKEEFFSADLEHERAVKTEEHHQFAKDHDLLSYFVSAKTGDSVEILFRQVTARLMHIVLPKNDSEATRVIKASIIRQESANETPINSITTQSNQKRTSICTLQ